MTFYKAREGGRRVSYDVDALGVNLCVLGESLCVSVLPGSGACMWCALECGRDIEREKGKEKKEKVHIQISKKANEERRGRKERGSERGRGSREQRKQPKFRRQTII